MATHGGRGSLGRGAVALTVVILSTLASASAAGAAVIVPSTTADELDPVPDAKCSLREAISAANTDSAVGGCPAGAGHDTIRLRGNAVYRRALTGGGEDFNQSGDLDVRTDSLNITASGPGATIAGSGSAAGGRVLHIGAAITANVSGVTIRNGYEEIFEGGGIRADGTLNLRHATLISNFAINGGGISNAGGVVTTLTNVTITGNSTPNGGGGVEANGGFNINSSTITGNIADVDGDGGLSSEGGGGVRRFTTSHAMNIRNTIVAGNFDNTIAGGTVQPDCSTANNDPPLQSQGYNLIGDDQDCNFAATTGDLLNVSARLGPLADNGGFTRTYALLPGSRAINRGSPGAGTACATFDQRGLRRQGRCDIGSYELRRCRGLPVNRVGTPGADLLRGTGKRDSFLGLGGGDRMLGRGGKDVFCGGPGGDRIFGGRGSDRVYGEAGADRLAGGAGGDLLKGGRGRDVLRGQRARDRLFGGPGADLLLGGPRLDLLIGGPGRDRQAQ